MNQINNVVTLQITAFHKSETAITNNLKTFSSIFILYKRSLLLINVMAR